MDNKFFGICFHRATVGTQFPKSQEEADQIMMEGLEALSKLPPFPVRKKLSQSALSPVSVNGYTIYDRPEDEDMHIRAVRAFSRQQQIESNWRMTEYIKSHWKDPDVESKVIIDKWAEKKSISQEEHEQLRKSWYKTLPKWWGCCLYSPTRKSITE